MSAAPMPLGRLGVAGLAALAALATLASPHAVALAVVDDAGRSVVLERPPARVVSLAPSLTELVFAAGAGATLVGVSALSDYPAEARRIARIGDAGRIDVERVLALRPDLVLVWQRGNLSRELEQLERAGVPLFQLEPQRLDDV
ncbi:MAG: helical backbone metal receptor, partial [Caldimonas sp.]